MVRIHAGPHIHQPYNLRLNIKPEHVKQCSINIVYWCSETIEKVKAVCRKKINELITKRNKRNKRLPTDKGSLPVADCRRSDERRSSISYTS